MDIPHCLRLNRRRGLQLRGCHPFRLGTTSDALVVNREGFWKSVYERSRNGKECFGGSQS